ncbi:MAG: NBR1-Ig-like domain-containing protein, partial [Gammaproteobacteria bacterium]|nr:NBR1-Ig-like domain-containing protein [Gammaproteobacteria bacterium]
WSSATGIHLSLDADSASQWDINDLTLESNERVAPEGFKTFVFPITAKVETGIYSLRFVLKRNGKPVSDKSLAHKVVVETRANRVELVSQLMPNTMNAGQKYNIVVQYKNNGTVNWTRKHGYQLGLKINNKLWKMKRIRLKKNEVIAPGSVATFQFELTAPNKAGLHKIQWQMQKWNRWFGEPAPIQQIKVVESSSQTGAEFVYQEIKGLKHDGNQLYAIINRGDIIPVNLTFKNTGKENWTEGHYSLISQNPANNMLWSLDRIELKPTEVIKPGQIKAFNFKIMAPLEPGIYHFQWQMVKGFNQWIGERSEDIAVTVK